MTSSGDKPGYPHTSTHRMRGELDPDRKRMTTERIIAQHPLQRKRLLRRLMVALQVSGAATIDRIYEIARERLDVPVDHHRLGPNVGMARRWRRAEWFEIEKIVMELAAEHLGLEHIEELAEVERGRDRIFGLEEIFVNDSLPFDVVGGKLEACRRLEESGSLSDAERTGLRVALTRHLLSDSLEYIAVAKHHLDLRSFEYLVEHTYGSVRGHGRIGGKAAGILLANRILTGPETGLPPLDVAMPESFYVRSDLWVDFLVANGLSIYQVQKYRAFAEIDADYPVVKELFKNARLPEVAVEQLARILEQVGSSPLIVRSSSLLEDSFGAAFSGKYPSFFLANQGPLGKRLDALIGAVLEVYAGVLAPDPLIYRRERNLIDYEEGMAVIIQKVIGVEYKHYWLPVWAGVAHSRNEHRWSTRIRKEDGLVRIVMGLGTRAVDRVGEGFPRMINLTIPSLRPTIEVSRIVAESQRYLDVINLRDDCFERIRLTDLYDPAVPFPCMDQMASIHREGALTRAVGRMMNAQPHELALTFDKWVAGRWCNTFREILTRLETAYRCPVDVEFSYDGKKLYILQCRPQSKRLEQERQTIPVGVPADDRVFSAVHDVENGLIDDIEYIVLVDPEDYARIGEYNRKIALGRVMGRLNQRLAEKVFIMLGPGRWGSSDINLGVNIRYADICHTRALIEVARQRDGMTPEVSYGTHFFLDLVESNISYLPLYPDEPDVIYNEAFLRRTPNCLAELLPEDAGYADCVRVIHVPTVADGKTLRLVMDGEEEVALAYLA